MKTTIYVFTKKRFGSILKSHGFKLRNMPVHARCGDEDELNKYEKVLEVSEQNAQEKVNNEVSRTSNLIEDNLNWFESNGVQVGATCMGYITESHTQARYYFWRK